MICSFFNSNTVSFIIGIFSSAVVTIGVLYLQFRGAVAFYRVKDCIECTKELFGGDANVNAIKNKYRYSMSVIFYRIKIAVKNWDDSHTIKEYPSMLKENNDGWDDYNGYVRPVLNDINSFAFISMLRVFGVKYMRQMKCLQNICLSVERITGLLDAIRLLEKHKKVKALDLTEIDSLRIIHENASSDEIKNSIVILEKEYRTLFNLWNDWLRINKIDNNEVSLIVQ